MKARAVQLILKRCLGHRDGEAVLVVTDPPMEPHARDFLQHAHAMGIDTTLLTMPQRQTSGEEPPRAVAEAMKSVPVSVLLTSRSLTHTLARREACEKHGARIASMPGSDPARLEVLLDLDYDDLRARGEELAGKAPELGPRGDVRLGRAAGGQELPDPLVDFRGHRVPGSIPSAGVRARNGGGGASYHN